MNKENKCRFCSKPTIWLSSELELNINSPYCEYHAWRAENGEYDDYC